MEKSKHIAALDLGTSKIKAMVARKDEAGALSIIASEQIESENCIRRGCVFNVDETSEKVSRLIKRLNGKLNSPIEKIYVGIGGQSLHTKPYSIKKEVAGGIVTQELIDSIIEESKDYIPETPGIEMFDSVSPEFYLDGQLNHNPKGATASEIEAKFQLILGRSTLRSTLMTVTDYNSITKVESNFLISPLATAKAVLTDKEKKLGCALVEFGAGVTYVSVYKSGSLKYMVTIPLGGNVITKDIVSLNILGKDAEELKLKYGSDSSENQEKEEINSVIEARVVEIIANVNKQIEMSGYAQALGSGIIITGGASLLNNLTAFFPEKIRQKVRLAEINKTLIKEADEQMLQAGNTCIIGLLSMGTEDCLKEIIEVKKPEPVSDPNVDMFGNPIGGKGSGKKKNPEENDKGGGRGKFRDFLQKTAGSLFGEDSDNDKN